MMATSEGLKMFRHLTTVQKIIMQGHSPFELFEDPPKDESMAKWTVTFGQRSI